MLSYNEKKVNLKVLSKKYPRSTSTLTYIPKANTLTFYPPLLGRFKCIDRFNFLFSNFVTSVSLTRKSKK